MLEEKIFELALLAIGLAILAASILG